LLAADSGLNSPQAAALLRQWPPGAGSVIAQSSNWKAAYFQHRRDFASPAALQDLRVRRALAHALDKPAINDAVHEGQDLIAESMFPPTSPLGRAANAAATKYPLDLQKSAQLMAEAGFTRGSDRIYTSPSGGRLTAELMASAGGATEMAAVASGWRQAGFEFHESATPAALAQDVRYRSTFSGIQISTSALGERGFQSLVSTNIPGPENNWRRGASSAAYAGYASPAMDRLVAAYATALALPDRIRAAVDIATQFDADFPAIPMFYPTSPWAFVSDLTGPVSSAPESNMAWNIHEWQLR
jgi:peptide/nickel transport system substrate-binding protein